VDLDDELKRLFADDRLDVQVAADAEKTVVAGARRRRRRRVALVSAAGVLAAAVVATGTIMLARSPGNTQTADRPELPITSTTSSTVVSDAPTTSSQLATAPQLPSSATTETTKLSGKPPASVSSKPAMSSSVPPVVATALNPNGYGPFRFGMSQAQVETTAQVVPAPGVGACLSYTVLGNGVRLYVSKASGLASIQVSSGVRTPDGIGVGSTEDDVKARYPGYRDGQVAVPGNTAATYVFTFSTKDPKTVTDLRMVGSSGC
jgi:cytoskeletal protein RodZ